jgi:hypothetical protein
MATDTSKNISPEEPKEPTYHVEVRIGGEPHYISARGLTLEQANERARRYGATARMMPRVVKD